MLQKHRLKKVLKVAFPETRGICETYADGTRGGVVYEWLVEIAKYTGWEYEFIGDSISQSIKIWNIINMILWVLC